MAVSTSRTQSLGGHQKTRTRTVKTTPLSHHEVMELVAPFSRQGYAVDMEASDRGQRRLDFRAIEVEAAPGGEHPALVCTLCLEVPLRAPVKLTRRLEADDALVATVIAQGQDPAALLDAVEQVAADRQFRTLNGVLFARSYRVGLASTKSSRRAAAKVDPKVPRLSQAEVRVGPVTLLVAEDEGRFLDVALAVDDGHRLDITEDFLSVLGWSWRAVQLDKKGIWRGRLKPPAREPQRTADLERLFDQAVAHLVETLASTPAEFHIRHQRARQRVAFQRLLPLLIVCALTIAFVVTALTLPKLTIIHILLQYVPIVGIVALTMMDKSVRIEIPPVPKPLQQSQWCPPIDAR